MKTNFSVARAREPLEIQMTSMIDVVFLLLVYFVWTASFMISEQILPSDVAAEAPRSTGAADKPDESPPPEADFDRVIVRIAWVEGGPQWLVNDEPLAGLAALRDQLTVIARINAAVPVILHPDPDVPLGDVIAGYDAVRAAGFSAVRFAARA